MKKSLLILCIGLQFSVNAAHQCNSNITETSPDNQFIDNNDGTVTDSSTGLMWMRCALGESWTGTTCTGTTATYNWQDALNQAESTDFASHADWRLPNIKELQSILELSCYDPAINVSIFPETANSNPQYWSSTLYSKENNHGAWALSHTSGSISTEVKSNSKLVRLVRN